MRQVDKTMFIANVKAGDIGVLLADNFFSTLQNWYRKKIGKVPDRASHAFFVSNPPEIIEANGLRISKATYLKNIGDKTRCWFFRYKGVSSLQIQNMVEYAEGALENGGTYSIGGIIQFGLRFFGIKKKISDEPGSFCSEFTSRIINNAGLEYSKKPPYEIDPSTQLSYFLGEGSLHWDQIGYYDGKGGYFIL